MQTALLILPNFVLIVIGLALARRFDFGRGFWDGLERLVYYVLFPALLFRSLAMASIDFAATGLPVVAALAFTFAGFVLSLAAGPLFRLERKLLASGSQCGYRFNTYVGLAIAGSLFGNAGVALAALLLGVMIPLANFLAVAMLASHGKRGFVHELATHPLLVSSLAGLAWNAAGLPLPG
ncbi:MAG TPA: AEC family transporter, partial [Usitatibacter sp.]